MNELPRRKPNRLAGYDYSRNGAYFVTICTKGRVNLFGKIVGATVPGRPSNAETPAPNRQCNNEIVGVTVPGRPSNAETPVPNSQCNNEIVGATVPGRPSNTETPAPDCQCYNEIVGATVPGRPSNAETPAPNRQCNNEIVGATVPGHPCVPMVKLTELGKIIETAILQNNRNGVKIDQYVIMPNHIHMIVVIDWETGERERSETGERYFEKETGNRYSETGDRGRSPLRGNRERSERRLSVQMIVRNMKAYITKRIGFSPWQKSFNDHIIRNEEEYYYIVDYIHNNPSHWESDCFCIGK
jgi:REP element-mobilizing transposase RayT